eukprot:GEZU01010227.1.p1 GENE.GEZU01010227.1~~GEZU01010227.1.p1  ORF type:complete len:295 (+),score=65.89 GEZU01010227.1:69-953(+)
MEEGRLEINKSRTKVWLVKIPEFIANEWSKIKEDNVELGKVIIEKIPDSNEPPKITLKISDKLAAASGHVKECAMEIKSQPPPIYIISSEKDNDQGKPMFCSPSIFIYYNMTNHRSPRFHQSSVKQSLFGTVEQSFIVKPSAVSEAYGALVRTRSVETNKKVRATMATGDEARARFLKPTSNTPKLSEKRDRAAAKQVVEKRQRIEKDELENMLFKAFESKQYWSLKELTEYTSQPVTFLKEILNELCILHKSGKHKSKYELKPEYQTKQHPPEEQQEDSATGGDAGANGGTTM